MLKNLGNYSSELFRNKSVIMEKMENSKKIDLRKVRMDRFRGNTSTTTLKKKSGASNGNNENRQSSGTFFLSIANFLIKLSILAVVFFLPLFFLPGIPSVIGLGKQVFLVAIAGFGFLVWIGKMAWKNEIKFRTNFILVPLLTFLAVLGLSTLFSDYVNQSLWGFFDGEVYSFISSVFFVAFFLLVFNNIKSGKDLILVSVTFLLGGLLVGLFGIFQLWNFFIFPLEITKSPHFNTIGSVYSFGAYIGALFIFSLALFLGRITKKAKFVLAILALFFFAILMVINLKIIWISLIVCIALLLGIIIAGNSKSESRSRTLPMFFLILTLLMILRGQPIIDKKLPTEVLISHKSSFEIALNSLKENFLFGQGPSLYGSTYRLFRPDSLGSFWAVDFNNASSYFLTLASTTGFLGVFGFLFLIAVALLYFFRAIINMISPNSQRGENDYFFVATGITWFFATIVIFVYLAGMSFLMIWWLSLALFLVSYFLKDKSQKEFVSTSVTPKSSLALSFVFVSVIIVFVSAIYSQAQKYFAAVHFKKALEYNTGSSKSKEEKNKLVEELVRASNLDPNRDVYFNNLAVTYFALANDRAIKKKDSVNPEDSGYISRMVKESLKSASIAQSLGEKSAGNYAILAGIYEGILTVMDGAGKSAIDNYEKAISLDPRNPLLYQKVAKVYLALAELEEAKSKEESTDSTNESEKYLVLGKQNIKKALEVKPDFIGAHLMLVSFYEKEGKIDLAIEKEKENKQLMFNSPEAAFRLGLLYYRSDKLDQAKKEFEYAIGVDKKYSNARYFLGLIYDKQNQKDLALKQFEKIEQFNPGNEHVKKIIDNLKKGKTAISDENDNFSDSIVDLDEYHEGDSDLEINSEISDREIFGDIVPEDENIQEEKEEKEE